MICIGFGTNEKWTSRLIRWATDSQWSHVWIQYPSPIWGGWWTFQSWSNGVVLVPAEQTNFQYPKRKIYSFDSRDYDLARAFNWARDRVGSDYDYRVIWNGTLLVLLKITGWKFLWDIAMKNAAEFSCSELACNFLQKAGVVGTEAMEPEFTTPGDLENFCWGSPDFRVEYED